MNSDRVLTGFPEVVCPALPVEPPDDGAGEVEGDAQLRGLVVPREAVMVVMPALAPRDERHKRGFHRSDVPELKHFIG